MGDAGRKAQSPGAGRCSQPLTSQQGAPRLLKPKDHLPTWPDQTLLEPLPHLSHTQGRENQGRALKSQDGSWGTQSRLEPLNLELPYPMSPGLLPSNLGAQRWVGGRIPGFTSSILTLRALPAIWPFLCPQQATSRQTTAQQNHWTSSTFWPLCSHNHIWGEQALTLISSCQQPSSRPTSSTALDPRCQPAGGHQEPNQTPVVKYYPCQYVYVEENP